MTSLDRSILVVGSGFSGLITAKTLLDDGFVNVALVTSADRIGGIWASGSRYPGVLTNVAHGLYELSGKVMPAVDLERNEHRILGVTITDYLEDFYSENMEGRLPVQFQQEVILLSRSETGKGWDVKTRSTVTDEESSHAWDVVVLAHGALSVPRLPSGIDPARFRGLLFHSSQIWKDSDALILDQTQEGSEIVVVGSGKSALDLARRYCLAGRSVTIAFDKPQVFNVASPTADRLGQTRFTASLMPPQYLATRLERFLHQTWLGGLLLQLYLRRARVKSARKLRLDASASLQDPTRPSFQWRPPALIGGTTSSGPDSFFQLVADGKIKVISGVRATGISEDGRLLLSDGSSLPASVLIFATGYTDPFSFIPLATRVELGLVPTPFEDERPSPFAGIKTLSDPPRPPLETPSYTRIYKGIVPLGSYETKDLALCGFTWTTVVPYTSEITAHWIAEWLHPRSLLDVPETLSEAHGYVNDYLHWLKWRWPGTVHSRAHVWIVGLNSAQYHDGLLQDMGVDPFRQGRGLLGLGYYLNSLKSSQLVGLGEERRARRAYWERVTE